MTFRGMSLGLNFKCFTRYRQLPRDGTRDIRSRIQLTEKPQEKFCIKWWLFLPYYVPYSWANSLCEGLQYEVKRTDKKL